MTDHDATRKHTFRTFDGVEALVSLDSGELFLDLPMNTPRYIRVREGERILEGDVRTNPDQMGSGALSQWRIDSITTDTVTGVDLESGESREWEREWLVRHLGSGGFSAELTDFDRVSVSDTTGLTVPPVDTGEQRADAGPHVVVTAYGNDGQKFVQSYAATEAGDWGSLRVVERDGRVQEFDDELREKFDAAVEEAFELEQQYH